MFWQLLLISAVTWIIYYRWQRRRLYKIAKDIPSGIKSYPVIGHAYILSGNDEGIADPMCAETVEKTSLQKDEHTVRFIRTVIGNGSIFARVNIWRPRRKILAPIFSLKNLHQFVTVFDQQSTIMTNLLAQAAGTGDFSIWKYITTYTFDAVCETTLDIKLSAQSEPDVPFLTAFDALLCLVSQRLCTPWMYPDFVYKNLACYKEFIKARQLVWDFVDELIGKKQKILNKRNQEGKESIGMKTFLEMMIEQSGKGNTGYTDLELREEAMVIIFAGTDTSAVGAAFATVMLSRYPQIQEKVYQELQDVFGNSDRPVTPTDLVSLKYLEVVIKETLRLYPPVPVTVREIEEDVELPTGDILVEGTETILHIWALHRNPKYWGEDAEEFRPERFLETPLIHPAQYQPFSQLTRNCLGLNYAMMSMKTVLANLFRRYIVLPPKDMDPLMVKEPLKVKHNIMMKHADNYMVRLVKRE